MEKKRRYGNKPREDKESLTIPKCPFCGTPFERPGIIKTELSEILGGHCQCGAVYACDETGKNLGEIYMDTLVLAAGGDWDRAMKLTPGEDYDEAVFGYISKSHTVPVMKREHRFDFSEKVLFIKLKKV
ncbi:MAG: hypothetical protein ACM34I_00275 [bacterium]